MLNRAFFGLTLSMSINVTGIFLPTTTITVRPQWSTPTNRNCNQYPDMYSQSITCPGSWPYKNSLHKCKRLKTRRSFSNFICRFLLLCGKQLLFTYFFLLHEVSTMALTFKIRPRIGLKSGTVKGKDLFRNGFLFRLTTTFNKIRDPGKLKSEN